MPKKSITIATVKNSVTKFRVVTTTNYLDARPGEYMAAGDVEALIASGVTVRVVEGKR